jgi:hypothetical protein
MRQFGPISGKKLGVIPFGPFFKIPLYFIANENSVYMTFHKNHRLTILEGIQIMFFYILINEKYSSYSRVSKSQKNCAFIKECSMDLQK